MVSGGVKAAPSRLGRFEVVRRLGEGGMGVVFEAVDGESSARVALKTLRSFDAETLFRLKEEFRALQDIRHPNLVSLGEMMRHGDEWFFTMELVDGVGLMKYVRHAEAARREAAEPPSDQTRRIVGPAPAEEDSWDSRPRAADFDEARLRASLFGLSRGLVALHAAGKVHRDIKPSNVLVTPEGRVVLLDFGLVLDASGVGPRDDFIVGSVPYMAPEQAANEEIGPAADWYSVGVILYECLTGRRPFEGAGSLVLTRKLTEDPAPPSVLVEDPPDDLEELCMELLRREPSERPPGHEVLRRLSARRSSDRPARSSVPPAAPPGRTPFVGRSAELSRLSGALSEIDGGEAVAVVVRGESGVGKSVLVRRFTQWVASTRPDAIILAGRCYELEVVPYKAFDGLMDALSRHLARLEDDDVSRLLPGTAWLLAQVFPVLRCVPVLEREVASAGRPRADMHETRARLFATVRELLTKLGERSTLVLVIDDLHWADPDSLALLAELLRPPLPPRLLLVATARPDAPLASLPGEVATIDLGRLPGEEAVALARLLLGGEELGGEDVAGAIAAEARGHPLFVDELVRHVRETGGRVPASLHLDEALATRIARLAAPERALVEVLAVAGVSLPHRVAMRASALDFTEFARCAAVLRAAHLARSGGPRGADAIEPYHDRVREAVRERLDEARRRDCHARIAGALEEHGEVDPDALATHWIEAGRPDRAAVYARRAADQAFESLAFDRAARLYERALSLPATGDADRQAMRVRRAESLANAGRSVDAGAAFREAARDAVGEPALELRRRSAEELLIGGRIDDGMVALRGVAGEVGMRVPPGPVTTVLLLLLFRALLWVRGLGFRVREAASIPRHALLEIDVCWSIARTLAVTDHVLGAYFQARMLLLALRCGEPVRLANALALETGYLAVGGPVRRRRATRVLEKAYALARRVDHPEALAITTGVEGFAALVQGRNREAVELSERGIAILGTNTAGFTWEARAARMNIAWALFPLGEIRRLSSHVRQALREADDRGDLAASTVYRTGLLNAVWLCTGDSEAARAVATEAARGWTQRGYHNQHYWSFFALLQIDLYEGKGRQAYERVVREWPRMRRGFILQMEVLRAEALHGRARAAVLAATQSASGERERLLGVAERDARRLEGFAMPSAQGLPLLVRAGVAGARGDVAAAAAALEQAIGVCESASAMLYVAAARRQLGLLRGGDAGRSLVREADAWMAAQDIADPARMTAMLVPGFADPVARVQCPP